MMIINGQKIWFDHYPELYYWLLLFAFLTATNSSKNSISILIAHII